MRKKRMKMRIKITMTGCGPGERADESARHTEACHKQHRTPSPKTRRVGQNHKPDLYIQ
jgi:hypothetical protein